MTQKVVINGIQYPYFDWIDHISSLHQIVTVSSTPPDLPSALKNAVKKRITKDCALFFSGGVDSSFIAILLQHHNVKFTSYTVGFQDGAVEEPLDITYALRVAKSLGLRHTCKLFTLNEAEKIIQQTVQMLPSPNVVDADFVVKVGVGAVVVAAASIAIEKVFFGGLGSEEIFAGYERHSKSNDINGECWSGLKQMWKRDFTRDCAIAQTLGLTLLTPFLDDTVIIEAMKFSGNEKIQGSKKKIILRKIAEEFGLPHEFAWRKKQGAQYGSKFDKAISILAKKSGFKTKGEYLHSLTR